MRYFLQRTVLIFDDEYRTRYWLQDDDRVLYRKQTLLEETSWAT